MRSTTIAAILGMLLVATPPALADAIADSSVVRRIEQTDERMRLSIDLERRQVEAQLTTMATAAAGSYPGVTVNHITVSRAAPAEIRIAAEVTWRPIPVLSCDGTLTGRFVIAVSESSAVHGEMLLDAINVSCREIPVFKLAVNGGGIVVAGTDRRIAIPGADGALERITVDSVDPDWIAVSLSVRTPAAPPDPDEQ